MSGELVRREQVGELVGRLADAGLDRAERGQLLTRLAGLLATGARAAGARAALSGRWLADVVADVAPHVPVRDLATLRDHHGGLSRDALAESLVRSASLATAGVGAAGGGLAAVQHAAPPTLLLAPLQLAAETVAVVAIELKLVAELHVVYGRAPVGTQAHVAAAHLSAWGRQRGLDLSEETPSLGLVLGTAARLQLRRRIVRRFGRNVSTLAPFLAGAVAGAELNRRETRALGTAVLADLRR
jgi:hypothetical protein